MELRPLAYSQGGTEYFGPQVLACAWRPICSSGKLPDECSADQHLDKRLTQDPRSQVPPKLLLNSQTAEPLSQRMCVTLRHKVWG